LDIHHGYRAVNRIENNAPGTRTPGRIVDWTEQTRLGIEKGENLLLIPDVITRGYNRNAAPHQINGQLRGDTAACGGILTVGHNEVGIPSFQIEFCCAAGGDASRLANHIPQKKNFHKTIIYHLAVFIERRTLDDVKIILV
jgi:hypothetical protein